MSRRRRTGGNPLVRITVVAIVVAVAAFGLIELGVAQNLVGGSGTDAGRAPAEPSRALERLEVAPPGSMAGYSREKFPHWGDADEFGWDGLPSSSCDVRDAALIRDGKDVRVADGCDVASGRWRDPYAGATYSDPSEMDIDHVVPLANAWRSGASSWDEALRERYANDPSVLLSTEAGEWYTVEGGPVALALDPSSTTPRDLHERFVEHLKEPGPVVSGNEEPTALTNFHLIGDDA